jgi:hypothetical protein
MALIKGKQIQSLAATKVVETSEKQFISAAEKAAFAAKQDALGFVPIDSALVGAANGVAGLDANGKVPLSAMPDMSQSQTFVKTNIAERDALTGLKSGDRVIVLDDGDGKKAGYIFDGTTFFKDFDVDWENINLQWSNIVDAPTSTTAEIDAAVAKTAEIGYAKTIVLTGITGTTINTGIRTDGTGANKTNKTDIVLAVNGYVQTPGADKDYTVAEVSNELVVTWLTRHFALEADDEIAITFTQLA